jgi:hypothetical protein
LDLSGVVPYVIDGGTSAVFFSIFLWLMVSGLLVPGNRYDEKQRECEELKAALVSERARGDAAVAAASATRDLLLAIGGRDAPKA